MSYWKNQIHWHRPGVDVRRETGNAVTACRTFYVQDVAPRATDQVEFVTCMRCVAVMPDHLALMNAEAQAARELRDE